MADRSDPYRIREMTAADLPDVFDVRVATWHNAHGRDELTGMGITPDSVAVMMASTHRGWVAETDGQVVGFAMGNRTDGEMWVIAVLPEHEGRGVGRRLLTSVEQWLWDEGCDEAWLTTDPDENYRAVGFYRRCGWTDWKREPGERFMRKSRPT